MLYTEIFLWESFVVTKQTVRAKNIVKPTACMPNTGLLQANIYIETVIRLRNRHVESVDFIMYLCKSVGLQASTRFVFPQTTPWPKMQLSARSLIKQENSNTGNKHTFICNLSNIRNHDHIAQEAE